MDTQNAKISLIPAPTLPTLSPPQQRFVQLYLETGIIKQSAQMAGVALETARKWILQKKIRRHLDHFRAKTASKCHYTAEDVANEAARIGFMDAKDAFKDLKTDVENGEIVIDLADWEKIDGRLIKSVKQDVKDGIPVVRLEFWDKIAALRLLQDHFKGQDPERHIHVHLSPEDLEKRDITGAAAAYRDILD